MSNIKVEILTQKGHKFLWIDDYLWMWDLPSEQKIQEELASVAFGNVLVAGYGLGLVQKYLLRNPAVKSVFTIEKHQEVTDACIAEYGTIYGDVGIDDFYNYVPPMLYDCVIGDVWEEIIPQSLEEYKKFKEKCKSLMTNHGIILAWGSGYFEYLIEKGI